MRKIMLRLIFFFLIMQLPAPDTVRILVPEYFQGSQPQQEQLAELASRAAALINLRFGTYLTATYKTNQAQADFTVDLLATFAGSNSSLIAMLKKATPGTIQPVPANIQGEITLESAAFLADGIFLQWAAFHDFFKSALSEPPLLVEEISTDALKKSLVSVNMGYVDLIPQGIAMKQNRNFVVGFSLLDAELDRFFKLCGQPGKSISDQQNNSYAFGIGITPGDTVYFKPSTGRDIYRVVEGLPRAQKWKAGMDLYGPFTVMPDGSVILIDQTGRRAVKVYDKEITDLGLFKSQYNMPAAVTTGPEGNLWVYDMVDKRIRIFTPRGEYIDCITPIIDPYSTLMPSSFAVFKDGSFVMSSIGELICFRKNGIPLWRIREIRGQIADKLPTMFYFTVDPDHGLIYLTDPLGKRIIKLLDLAYCRQHGISNPVEEKIIALNREFWADTGSVEPLIGKALLYEEKKAFEMARYLWEGVLDTDPFNETANNHLDTIEVMILFENARQLKTETLEILSRVGPASAERFYKLALQMYEEILSLEPGNGEAAAEIAELKQRFASRDPAAGKTAQPIKIEKLALKNIYPSLMHYYQQNPVGQVTITNTLKTPITEVRVNILIKRYMDSETETDAITLIKPGGTLAINLYAVLNENIFSLEEDLPKQAEVTVKYMVEGTEQSVTKNGGLTIYRRTSLNWDDSGKLAAFIMPNDGIVSGFSHKVIDEGQAAKKYKLSKRFFRAIRICDALGLYGIKYVEDPDSPFSRVLGKEEAVDTVRFPRTTLLIHSGDCDDSTALLGSLLESAGIPTAIMTTPGHVFLAFDTGEPEENIWQFQTSQFEAMSSGGTVWIPVETTLLKEGFQAAWAKSSEVIRQNREQLEFLPVSGLRAQYPPLPLPGSQFTIVEPESGLIDPVYAASVDGVVDDIYANTLTILEQQLQTAKGSTEARLLNQAGALHARFDKPAQAEQMFARCMDKYPTYTAAYVNVANLLMEQLEFKQALAMIARGLQQKPDSATLNLQMARCQYSLGNKAEVAAYYAKVKKTAPQTAERYAYLSDLSTGRARAADEVLPLIWLLEEE